VWKASRHGLEGERVHATDGQVRWRCTSEAKSSSGTDAGARSSGAVHGRANEWACARCRTHAARHGSGGVWTAGRGRKTPPMGGTMPLVARREGNRDDGIVQRREVSAAAAHSWACGRAKGRRDGKRLRHMGRARAAWQHAGGTAQACECHGLAGSVQLGRQRNTRVRTSMGTGWILTRSGRMPDVRHSHVDEEEAMRLGA
jgi:hypothetical protein